MIRYCLVFFSPTKEDKVENVSESDLTKEIVKGLNLDRYLCVTVKLQGWESGE